MPSYWTVEAEFAGRGNGWSDISSDVLVGDLTARYGNLGTRPTDLVAGAGTLSLTLDNSQFNSAGKIGYYSPQHTNKRAGFGTGIGVRLSVAVPGYTRHYKFVGTIDAIQPIAGINGPRRTALTITDWLDYASRAKVNALGVQLEKRSDQLFAMLVASLPVQPRAVQIGTGVDVYPFAFDNVQDESRTVLTELSRLARSEGGRIYLRGDDVQGGTLVFEPRAARIVSSSNVDTFTDAELHGLGSPVSRSQIINRAIAVTNQRRLGATNTEVIYDSVTRIGVPAGTPLDLFAPYRDPTSDGVERISALDVTEPVAGTDYTANVAEDGTGADITGLVLVDVGDDGNGAHVAIVNNAGVKAWVWFRIKGRPLVTYRTTVSEAQDDASLANQGEQSITIDMPYQSDAAVAYEVARHTIRLFAQPNPSPTAEFLIGEDELALLDRVLRREVGDRIGLTEEVTGLGTRGYFIASVEVQLLAAAVAVRWTLQPADQGNYWRNNVQGAGNVCLMIVAPGNLIGHADVPHADRFHSDIPHGDAPHGDGEHSDVPHADLGHADHSDVASPHQDVAHQDDPFDDVPHSDVTHVDAGTPHYDRVHADAPHYDTVHTNVAHDDTPHTDQAHDDTPAASYVHDDHQDKTVHYDGSTSNLSFHNDHYDGALGGYHGDSVHVDSPHFDVAHFDSGPHVDNAHVDTPHGDGVHGDDTHEDQPPTHQDVGHQDTPHLDDVHDDAPHGDHSDTAHVDSEHADVVHVDALHLDTPHGDVVHVDVVHQDAPHIDEG